MFYHIYPFQFREGGGKIAQNMHLNCNKLPNNNTERNSLCFYHSNWKSTFDWPLVSPSSFSTWCRLVLGWEHLQQPPEHPLSTASGKRWCSFCPCACTCTPRSPRHKLTLQRLKKHLSPWSFIWCNYLPIGNIGASWVFLLNLSDWDSCS